MGAAALVAAPVAIGVGYSAAAAVGLAGFGPHAFTLDRLTRVLAEPAVRESVWWTLRTAAAATALATAAAVVVAVMFRGASRIDRLARAFAVLPLPIPHLVAATTAVLVLGQSGLLARVGTGVGWLARPADMPALVYDSAGSGLVLMLAWKEFPFLAFVAFSVLSTRGSALEETARGLGASAWAAFRWVTWPLLWRGLAPAVAAVFAFAVGSYEAAVLLAPSDPLALPLLTLERYTDADLDRRGDAFVLALVALGIAALVVGLHEWLRLRAEHLES